MTIGSDSTVWTYAATIPAGEANNGIASIAITTTDLALNALRAVDVTNSDTLEVDNTLPTVVITYSDSLVKEDDVVNITATFNEKMTGSPQIAIDYAGAGADVAATNMTQVSTTVWAYNTITIPD